MKGRELDYFGGGNTAYGFVHHFESNVQKLNRLFILKGGPGTGKSTLMKSIGGRWNEKGYDVEWIHCSADVNSVDAVIIPALKVGIVDGTFPHVIEPRLPGVVDEYVPVGVWDRNRLLSEKREIESLNNEINLAYRSAYNAFYRGLREHDLLETYYIGEIDREKAKKLGDEWIAGNIPNKRKKSVPVEKHRFLGSSTPDGPVDFVENLTSSVTKRFFIKGRPGSGKSTLLKRIAKTALEKGYSTEIYHCGFDPKSLDMVIVRELDWAIFDSTAPHEYFPTRENDEIIDLYRLTITPGTDEKYAAEIQRATEKYKGEMEKGMRALAEVKKLRMELKEIYSKATDFAAVNQIQDRLNEEITKEEGIILK